MGSGPPGGDGGEEGVRFGEEGGEGAREGGLTRFGLIGGGWVLNSSGWGRGEEGRKGRE